MIFSNFEAAIQRGIEKRLHLGVQASFSVQDKVYDLAVGEAAPGQPLTVDDSVCWLSAAKPLTAVAILLLEQRGELDLAAPVSDNLPEFVGDGKSSITWQHLLTHTSPLQEIETGWPESTWREVIQKICVSPLKPDWQPGKRAAYLPAVSWFLLGEIIQRCSQLPFEKFIQQEILAPAGMEQTVCVATDQEQAGNKPRLYDRVRGQLELSAYEHRLDATSPSPGSTFRGPARELRRFYDWLLRQLEGEEAGESARLQPHTLERMIERHRKDLFDETLQHQIDYGLGVILNSEHHGPETVPYGYGAGRSEQTFGHGGSQCAIGWADPVQHVSAVIVANGRCGEGLHQRRFREFFTALSEDFAAAGIEF